MLASEPVLVVEMVPGWIKWVHVVGVFVYAGGFLTLTRMLGKAVRYESAVSRAADAPGALRWIPREHLPPGRPPEARSRLPF